FLVPKLPFGNAFFRNPVSALHPCRAETEFRRHPVPKQEFGNQTRTKPKRRFQKGVWNPKSTVSWFPNSRLGTPSSETPFRPCTRAGPKRSFADTRFPNRSLGTRREQSLRDGFKKVSGTLKARFPGSQTPVWERLLPKLRFGPAP